MTESQSPDSFNNLPSVPAVVPELYANSNTIQKASNIEAFESIWTSTRRSASRPDQQILDVGCGTGDFTCHELLPRCQPCRRIVGTDASEEMVRYAKEHFGHPQVSYEVHDIAGDTSGLVTKYGKFDQIYSFHALHWVKDQKAAFRSIADLMTDDGECFLFFMARWAGYEAQRKLVQMDRWKPHKQLIENFIPKTQDLEDSSALESYMLDVLENAGLKPHLCKVSSIVRTAKELLQVAKMSFALIPILPLLPEESRPELEADLTDVLSHLRGDPADAEFHADKFVIHATKLRRE